MSQKDSNTREFGANVDALQSLFKEKRTYTNRGGKTTREGVDGGFKRTTIVVHEHNFRVLQIYAKLRDVPAKDVLDEAIASYIEREIPPEVLDFIERTGF